MKDTQRTLFAGLLIALLTLTIPFYLQFIGLNVETDDITNLPEKIEILEGDETNKQEQIITSIIPSSQLDREIETSPNKKEILIETEKFSVTLSNYHGGSIDNLRLNSATDKGYQYVGGYNLNGLYEPDENTLLFNKDLGGCSPCLMFHDVVVGGDSFWTINQISLFSGGVERDVFLNNYNTIKLVDADSAVVTMSLYLDKVHSVSVLKLTTFYNNSFIIKHDYQLNNINEDVSVSWFGGLRPTEQNLTEEITYSQAFIAQNKDIEDVSLSPSDIDDKVEKLTKRGQTDWVATRNKYFINALVSNKADGGFIGGNADYLNYENEVLIPAFDMGLSFNNTNNLQVTQFIGPLDVDIIEQSNTYLDRVMNFGWLPIQPFSRSALWLLKTLNLSGLNYGIILILFAFFIRLLTGPLTKKSFQSSQKMQEVQPKLKKIQEKYKKNPQKLNQEMVKLYKTEGVNPIGGCLPMLIQMPLLFSLFIVFRSTIEFRGAAFFWWITDLSKPDVLFNLPFYVPIYGAHVGLLPVVLGISMFLSQKLSMANMESKQKPMMYMMTAFFFLLFNQFPSGLNLYYTAYNILNYFQQKSLKKV